MECTQRGAQKSAPPARFLLSVFRVVLTPAVAGIMRAQGVEVDSAEDLAAVRLLVRVSKIGKIIISKILQIFGGLVLGCIKTKLCRKICV